MKKLLSIILCITLLVTLVAGCQSEEAPADKEQANTAKESDGEKGSDDTKETVEEPMELLEYSFMTVFSESPRLGHDNPNDVVTPAIEEMWNIKVTDIMFSGGMSPVERINMLVAADAVPDVVMVDNPNIEYFYETGAFKDLTAFKPLMEKKDIFITDAGWNRLMVDGKLVAAPASMSGGEIDVNHPAIKEFVANDVFYKRPQNWALVANQDILEQAGYTFKKIDELQAELDLNVRSITDADVQIEPAIKTLEDFETMLYKIQALNLTVDGKPVIPLSIPEWAAYHVAALNSPNGGWTVNPDTMEVSAYQFNPGMKEFYQKWTQWYKDGVVDPEYVIHKGEQYQEKAAQGRVAIMLPAFDTNAVRQNLQAEGNDLKVIPWPDSAKDNSVDPSHPGGYGNLMFSNNLTDAEVERLIAYFDWANTEEGMDLLSWGPESAGLWEIKDGVKVLKDNELWEAIKTGSKTEDGRDAEYYGLSSVTEGPLSKAALTGAAPLYNMKSIQRSYPASMDAFESSFIYVSTEMLNRDGTVLPPMGEAAGALNGYYWGTVKGIMTAELFISETDEEWEQAWENILQGLKDNGYDQAVEDMTVLFKKALGK